jgi:hypothetical protein
MFLQKLLVLSVLICGAVAFVVAQHNPSVMGKRTMVVSRYANMTVVTERPRSFTTTNILEPGLTTIFNSLAAKYPKGMYWCCEGYNVMGPNSGAGEQWMAAAFTPAVDHTVTRIAVAVGYSQQGTNGVVMSLNEDNNGVPGQPLKTWNASGLPRFGTCCTLVVESDSSGIPISGGKQYWIVLSTNSSQSDTVDGWNVEDMDQIDTATLASYTNNKWTVFQATPGVGFVVQGSN